MFLLVLEVVLLQKDGPDVVPNCVGKQLSLVPLGNNFV